MITDPGISTLMNLEKVDSKYTLVIAVAKRAREIAYNGVEPLIKTKSTDKPISIAVHEIAEGKVDIIKEEDRPKNEIAEALNGIYFSE